MSQGFWNFIKPPSTTTPDRLPIAKLTQNVGSKDPTGRSQKLSQTPESQKNPASDLMPHTPPKKASSSRPLSPTVEFANISSPVKIITPKVSSASLSKSTLRSFRIVSITDNSLAQDDTWTVIYWSKGEKGGYYERFGMVECRIKEYGMMEGSGLYHSSSWQALNIDENYQNFQASWDKFEEIESIVLAIKDLSLDESFPESWTLLHWAAYFDKPWPLSQFLKDPACDFRARDQQGRTAIEIARANSSKKAVKILETHIACGINSFLVHEKNSLNEVALMSDMSELLGIPQKSEISITSETKKKPISSQPQPHTQSTNLHQTHTTLKPPQKNPRKSAEITQAVEIKHLQEQVKLLQKTASTPAPQVHLHAGNEAVTLLTEDVLAKIEVLQNSEVSPEEMQQLQENITFLNWLAGNEVVMTKVVSKGLAELENEELVNRLKQDPTLYKFYETVCMQFMSLFSAARLYGYVAFKPNPIAKTSDNVDIVLRGVGGLSKSAAELLNLPLFSAILKGAGKLTDEVLKDLAKKTFKSIYQFYKGDTASIENFIKKIASTITFTYQNEIMSIDRGENGVGRLVNFILQKFIFYITEKQLTPGHSDNQEDADVAIQGIIQQLGAEREKTFTISKHTFKVPFAAFYVAQKGSRFANSEDPSIKAKFENLWKDSVFKLGIDCEGLISAVDILSNKGKMLSPALEPLSNPSGIITPQSSSTYQGRSLGSLFDKEGQNIRDALQKKQETREAIKKILAAISKTDKPIAVSDDMQKYFSAVLSAKLNEILLKYYLLGKGHHLVAQEINVSPEIVVTEFKDKASNVTLSLDPKNATLIIAYPAFATIMNDDDVLYTQNELNRFIQELIAIIISPYAAALHYLRPESVQVLALFCARRICAALEYAAESTDDLAVRIKTGNTLTLDIKQAFKKEGKSPEIFTIEGETSSAKIFLQSHETFKANLSGGATTTMVEHAPSPVLTPEMTQLFMAFAQEIRHLNSQISVLTANVQPTGGIEIEMPERENPQFAQLITNFTNIYSPPLQAVPGSATPHVPALQPRVSPSPI
jgi:hypothetical protein